MQRMNLLAVALLALAFVNVPAPALAKGSGGHARYQKVAPSGKPKDVPVKKKKVAKTSKDKGGSQAWSKSSSGKGH